MDHVKLRNPNDTLWFVNYTDQPVSGPARTTSTQMFNSLDQARAFAKARPERQGYITSHTSRGDSFSCDGDRVALVETFGGFEPSALEARMIEAATGAPFSLPSGSAVADAA